MHPSYITALKFRAVGATAAKTSEYFREGIDMAKKRVLILIFICGAASNIAYGDGKFFRLGLEKVPVGVPYQRAMLMFEGGKEMLVLQSKYKTGLTKDINSIAWVVPVPAVPELASMDASAARTLFLMISLRSSPKIINTFQIVPGGVIVFIIILILANQVFGARGKKLSKLEIAVTILVLLFLYALLMPTLHKAGSEVDILKVETVGIYDVKVIKGNDANAVTGWLKENGFGYDETDSKMFDQYVKKGWCFVTAKVNRKADKESSEVISQGLAAPLVLRFDAKEAVYPMALTATAGSDTEILLYVYSHHKMDCGDRLKLAFAGEVTIPFNERSSLGIEPNTFFEKIKEDGWYLCKFKGTLKPDQMTEDIIFKHAKDDDPYREIKWR